MCPMEGCAHEARLGSWGSGGGASTPWQMEHRLYFPPGCCLPAFHRYFNALLPIVRMRIQRLRDLPILPTFTGESWYSVWKWGSHPPFPALTVLHVASSSRLFALSCSLLLGSLVKLWG
jgi:hypothetical protein